MDAPPAVFLASAPPADDPAERFASMSVTRTSDAVIRDARAARVTRAVLRTDDVPGARPRSLPPTSRADFHGVEDIEGARPRVLHRAREAGAHAGDLAGAIPGVCRGGVGAGVGVGVGVDTRGRALTRGPRPTSAVPPPLRS